MMLTVKNDERLMIMARNPGKTLMTNMRHVVT